MDDLLLPSKNYFLLKVMIKKIVQIHETDIHQIELLVLDFLQFHEHAAILNFAIFTVIENPTLTKFTHVQDTPNFKHIEEILNLLNVLPPKIVVSVLYLDSL